MKCPIQSCKGKIGCLEHCPCDCHKKQFCDYKTHHFAENNNICDCRKLTRQMAESEAFSDSEGYEKWIDCAKHGPQKGMHCRACEMAIIRGIPTANQLLTEQAIYQKGFGDGHKEAREYAKKLIADEVWKFHELSVDFLKLHSLKASSQLVTEINEMCVKSHNEVLEKLIDYIKL